MIGGFGLSSRDEEILLSSSLLGAGEELSSEAPDRCGMNFFSTRHLYKAELFMSMFPASKDNIIRAERRSK